MAASIITWLNKVGIIPYGTRINQWQDRDSNEVKDAINDHASLIDANTAKISYTDAAAVAANTAKISYTDAAAVALNTAKTGITTQQAADITTNNAKISYTDAAAVAANTAKVTFPEAPIDGSQYARQDGSWSTVAAGGTEYQIYTSNFQVGNTTAGGGYWSGMDYGQLDATYPSVENVIRGYIGVQNPSTLATVSATTLKTFSPIGVANANQTVESLKIYVGNTQNNRIQRIGMVKVLWSTSHTAFTSLTTLFEDNAVAIGADGFYDLLAAGFTTTTISENEHIYLFMGMDSNTQRLRICNYRLKCSID